MISARIPRNADQFSNFSSRCTGGGWRGDCCFRLRRVSVRDPRLEMVFALVECTRLARQLVIVKVATPRSIYSDFRSPHARRAAIKSTAGQY